MRSSKVTLMMKAVQTSETVNSYQSTQCYNPEDIHLHTHHHENLKSDFLLVPKLKNTQGVRGKPKKK
jgi:hypothetical protein